MSIHNSFSLEIETCKDWSRDNYLSIDGIPSITTYVYHSPILNIPDETKTIDVLYLCCEKMSLVTSNFKPISSPADFQNLCVF